VPHELKETIMPTTTKARRAAKQIEEHVEDSVADMTTVANDMRKDFDAFSATVTQSAQDAIASVSDRMKAAGFDPDVFAKAAQNKAVRIQDAVADELQARPLRTLGIAAAVGLMVGLLSTR
jgi:ElaB/YqjD/DUF883 family membrane-anchored ribosome-binding protein